MDWNGRVDDAWLDSFALNDWLDSLMNVMVNMLTSNSRVNRSCVLCLANFTSVLELGTLGIKSLLYVVVVAMVNLLVLNPSNIVGVLLWKNLLILNWLDRSVVVVLVNLTINSSSSLLMLGLGDVLVGNSWVNCNRKGQQMVIWMMFISYLPVSWTVVSFFPSLARKPETAAFALSILRVLIWSF